MTTIASSIEQLHNQLAAEVAELANANISADSPTARVTEILKRLSIARQTEAELSGREMTEDEVASNAALDADTAAAAFARNECVGKPEKFDATYRDAREKLNGAAKSVKHSRVEKNEQFQRRCDEFRTTMNNTFDALKSAYSEGVADGQAGRHTQRDRKHWGRPVGDVPMTFIR